MKSFLGLILGGYIYPIYPRRYDPGIISTVLGLVFMCSCTYLFTCLLIQLALGVAVKLAISQKRLKIEPKLLTLYEIVHGLSIAAKMYDIDSDAMYSG